MAAKGCGYSVSGRVAFGLSSAGGVNCGYYRGGRRYGGRSSVQGLQPGGPSSGLLPANLNDVPLDFDTLQPHGTFIGSAAVVVLSDQDKVRDAALNMLRFEDESCGQCTPCRTGCVRFN